MRVTCKETGMWIESTVLTEAEMRATLEYRRDQLSPIPLKVKK